MADEEDNEDGFSTLHAQWITKPDEKIKLRGETGKWKCGMWTVKEMEVLRHNVKEFLEEHNLTDPAEVIFGRRNHLRSQFFRCVARNIRRPLFAVYRKVCRDFNVENYVCKWSAELTEQLLIQHSLHGNKWSTIGRAIGVSARAARDRYRQVSHRQRIGEWDSEEEERLLAAMIEFHGEAIVQQVVVKNSSPVTWERVARFVETRNAIQCRLKWLYTELKDRGQKGKKRWGDQEDLDLLSKLCLENAEDEEEVDWTKLSSGWESVRSPNLLRNKWSCLRRHVPGYALKSFEENLEHLVEHFMPILKRRIERAARKTELLSGKVHHNKE